MAITNSDIESDRYYDLEQFLFNDVHRRFHDEGSIGAFDFFSIVIWKANRAKSRIARRLLAHHSDLEGAARDVTSKLFHLQDGEQRLKYLMLERGFLLPMASAILTVLWPDEFTVYDIRVCGELRDFGWLANRSPNHVCGDCCRYIAAVRGATPPQLTLRDKDRFLWGKSAARQLTADIKKTFANV